MDKTLNIMEKKPRITISVPCFLRPKRTRRIIESVLNQNINNWEAFIIGDGCPEFQKMIDSGEIDEYIKTATKSGNKLISFNLEKNYGGFGYQVANYAIKNASGEFFIFAGNDDKLLDNHFEHYLSEIENTDLDLVYYKTFIEPINQIRDSKLQIGEIGHSEIIIRTNILSGIKQKPIYAADWEIITNIMKKTNKTKKADSNEYTYIVTHIGGQTSDKID
jgi:glycosyltransferase involved in cell wall biosynthesis